MVGQYQQRHGRLPRQIVLTPLALLALAIKDSAKPVWQSVPVVCRESAESEAAQDGVNGQGLGVFVLAEDRSGRLVSCDLQL
jgi:hypothetical protein